MSGKLNQSLDSTRAAAGVFDDSDDDYLYDRADVRAVGILLYSIVFIAGFFGNLIVILVVTVHWKMRSITNFCLANLGFADFCVSIFCVYQNMYIYFMSSWVFGGFLCKMYYFITELSHTASILILVVICIERYLAIVHPMRCKEWLTLRRLRVTIIGVWSLSAIYCSPRLYFTNIRTMTLLDGSPPEILCIPIRTLYDSHTFDMVSFALLFVLPLTAITILYTRIALVLWESSKNQMPTPLPYTPSTVSTASFAAQDSFSSSMDAIEGGSRPLGTKHTCTEILCCGFNPWLQTPNSKRSNSTTRQSTRLRNRLRSDEIGNAGKSSSSSEPIVIYKFDQRNQNSLRMGQNCTILFNGKPQSASVRENSKTCNGCMMAQTATTSVVPTKPKRMTVTRGGKYGSRALESRRRIIKMLVIIVFAFAVCNLPFHARKIWQYYGSSYFGGSTFSSVFTPLTFLVMYANSGVNPILYAFMSKKFRICFQDLIRCKLRRSMRNGTTNASVRSTHLVTAFSTPG